LKWRSTVLKIHINENPGLKETEITINCNKISTDVEKIISILRVMDLKLTGRKDDQTYILDASTVLYIDTVDKKTFFYTKKDVYETDLKLYELEEQLASLDFIRSNKSCIINFNQIVSIKADIDGKLLVTMSNQEKLFVSRQYAPVIKNKLGVK
jgi:two-component system, LytTR family, response regulator LytT